MIWSASRKFCFIHIPKTGGTTITAAYEPHMLFDDVVLGGTMLGEALQSRYRDRFGVHKHSGAFAGAWTVTALSPDLLRKVLPLVLLAVLAYTLAKKDLGRHHAPRFSGNAEVWVASLVGLGIGFYDGFFGPGTGSFFVFLFVRLLGYDFLNASASAKLLNCATNIAAISLFAFKGHVWWHYAVTLAIANVVGSMAGTHMALKHGTGFVRGIFIVVVSSLILKTGYDAFLR